MQFNVQDFQKNSVVKFYYDKGRHASTSLRLYGENLFVHKLLGVDYRNVSDKEYKKEVALMKELYEFLQTKTKFNLPETVYVGYNSDCNCIERVEKFSGITLRYAFPTTERNERVEIAKTILDQIASLIKANNNKLELDYSVDPTPDNFTYNKGKIYFIDFMPPLVRGKRLDPQLISDKSRNTVDLSVQIFRYFNQKGLYLTFLTKFGAVDITFFHKLFKLTLDSIKNQEVKDYIYNDDIKFIESLAKEGLYCWELLSKIGKRVGEYSKLQRDMLRLLGVYFLYDMNKIETNARKYRVKEVISFLEDKKCTADLVSSLIYSEFRSSALHEDFKEMVINLIALQYGR
jgi:hypothetical protein